MPRPFNLRTFIGLIGLVLGLPGIALAQQSNDSGTVTLSARVSGYVDLTSGGPATLVGTQGGTITGNTNKGDRLTGVTIDLGEISPVNANTVVRAIVPLRLRSNVNYTLSVSTTGFSNADPLAIQASDVGFGVGNVRRTDPGVNPGTDTAGAAGFGDPSADADANATTPRWEFATARTLSYYTTAQKVLSGPRIMQVVPASFVGGLTLDTYFAVKPQFFTPGSFTTTVTYTITTP
jgi:hypothetical protein